MRYIAILFAIFHSITCIPQHSSSSDIIKHTSHFFLGNNGMAQLYTMLIQINNRSADTEINIPYSKGDKVTINNIWIEDLEGNIILKLKNNDIKDRSYISSISLYENDFVKYFNVRHDIYPYRIYYTYNIKYAKSLNTIDIDYSNSKLTFNFSISV